MTLHRLLISAPHRSSGKTTITIGLAAALTAHGARVQPFKKGPDYIDPMWLSSASGRPCYNLDPSLMDDADMERMFREASFGADLALVEGTMGLHDGTASDGSNSNAALARRLKLPVVLVVDTHGMNRGIAPLLLGFQAFERDVRIAGVILNRVGSARHEAKLRTAIERYTDIPVLGAVADDKRLAMDERHLGLVTCGETHDAQRLIHDIGRIVGSQVDLGAVNDVAASAPEGFDPLPPLRSVWRADVRIAIARDRAFSFYYPDDLAALEAAGAELVFFDTLRDMRLPAADGLFIGGGFPETCMAELEANVAMRTAVRGAIEDGMPAYAECGGLMYLARSIAWQGRRARMAGAIPGDAVMRTRPVGRGYVRLEQTADLPWPGAFAGRLVAGHEFHHSALVNLPEGMRYAWRVKRGHGIDGAHDGVRVNNLVASYSHLRAVGGTDWAARFVAFVRECRALRRTDFGEPLIVESSR